jgi:hypothetical protein
LRFLAGARGSSKSKVLGVTFGIPIAVVIELWLGGAFAFCAAARIRADGPWAQPPVTIVALFAVIVLAPATAYAVLAHPDWAWLYLFDARRLPRMFVVPAVAAGAAALLGGYYLVARLLAARVATRHLLAGLAGSGAAVVLLAAALGGRLWRYGTYADYHARRASALFDVKLGFVLVALAIGLTAAAVYVAWEIWRDGHKAPAR